MTEPLTISFQNIESVDADRVGAKGFNLARMMRAGIPVPDGFVITTGAFREQTKGRLGDLIKKVTDGVDVNDPESRAYASARLKQVISSSTMNDWLEADMLTRYRDLGEGHVAVRSSAPEEDTAGASFAGQHASFLHVRGAAALMRAVLSCMASLFEERAMVYRLEKGISLKDATIAVVVQQMIPANQSGVMFTADPTTGDASSVIIEAVLGLGEGLVSGAVTPDQYRVDKATGAIELKLISEQKQALVERSTLSFAEPEHDEATTWRNTVKLETIQKVKDHRIVELAAIAMVVEDFYGGVPQDIEWAKRDGVIYVVQARPITVGKAGDADTVDGETPILQGLGVSPGVGQGMVRVITDPEDFKSVKGGDVLVTPMTTPDFVPVMKRVSAIVCNEGGFTCHAAIISRELGVPCVVGAKLATTRLAGVVKVDGSQGAVYQVSP